MKVEVDCRLFSLFGLAMLIGSTIRLSVDQTLPTHPTTVTSATTTGTATTECDCTKRQGSATSAPTVSSVGPHHVTRKMAEALPAAVVQTEPRREKEDMTLAPPISGHSQELPPAAGQGANPNPIPAALQQQRPSYAWPPVPPITIPLTTNYSRIPNFPKESDLLGDPRYIIFGLYMDTPGKKRMGGYVRWVESLRASGSNASVVLGTWFTQMNELQTALSNPKFKVNIIGIPQDLLPPQHVVPWSVNCLRVFVADMLIQSLPNVLGWMMSDVKDVIFQQDPFAYALPVLAAEGKHILAAEEKSRFLEREGADWGTTAIWMRQCFGNNLFNAAARAFYGRPILCSGTTIGTGYGMRIYLRTWATASIFRPRSCLNSGLDQGTSNWVLYANATLRQMLRTENGATGRVLTYHGTTKVYFNPVSEKLVNHAGQDLVITHQVNRCGMVMANPWEGMKAKTFTFNETFYSLTPGGQPVLLGTDRDKYCKRIEEPKWLTKT